MNTLEEVLEFVRLDKTYMEPDVSDEGIEEDDTELIIRTRENGCVGDEEHAEEDFQEALALERRLQHNFGDSIETDVETCDEWIHLTVTPVIK